MNGTRPRTIVQKSGSSFTEAFRFLAPLQRDAIHTLYAFCRVLDDAVDEPKEHHAAVEPKASNIVEPKASNIEEVARWRTEIGTCFGGRLYCSPLARPTYPLAARLAEAIDRFRLTPEPFEALLGAVESDLFRSRYRTFAELAEYCHGVASAVGILTLQILDYRGPEAEAYARAQGLALQLTNILRDVGADARRGRIYLPLDEVEWFGYSERGFIELEHTPEFLALMRFQASRAREYYREAEARFRAARRRDLVMPEIMRRTYLRLLDRMERGDFDLFRGRFRLRPFERRWIALRTWADLRWGGR